MWWALIRKELREIAPYAIVGAVYCLLVVLALHSTTRHIPSPLAIFGLTSGSTMDEERETPTPPFNGGLEGLLVTFTVLMLLGFGLRQTLGEELKRTYPLLLHRPMGRNSLFLLKMSVGVAVYLFLTLSVILILAIDSAVPGHYAYPFKWEMVFSSLTIPVGGIAFYLVIFLTGLRRERWYGTRWLPAIAGFMVLLFLIRTSEVWQYAWLYVMLIGIVGILWILLAILDQFWKRDF